MKAYVQRVSEDRQGSFVYRSKSDARFARGWHCHPEIELTHIVESRGRRFVGSRVDEYASGELVMIGANLPHTWRSRPNPNEGVAKASGASRSRHRAIVAQFRPEFLGMEFMSKPEFRAIASLLQRSSRGLEFFGETRSQATMQLRAMRSQSRFERLMSLLEILQSLANAPRSEVRTICPKIEVSFPTSGLSQRRIDRALEIINQRFDSDLTQAEVAKALRMTPAAFSRFFRRTLGCTFVAHLSELRVTHACGLLVDSDESIVNIAMQSGFNNLSNFNRRFRELRNVTPREYRREHQSALYDEPNAWRED